MDLFAIDIGHSSLSSEELEELQRKTVFEAHEIMHLYRRFEFLDRSSKGTLSYVELQMIPELHSNPFFLLIVGYLERVNNFEKIRFSAYLEFLSAFSSKTPKDKRIDLLFDIFENNGRLGIRTLSKMQRMMTGKADDKQVSELLRQYDKGKKGYLSKKDFSRLYLSDERLDKNMVIDFSENIPKPIKVSWWDILWPFYRR